MKEDWKLEMRQKMEGYKKPAPELSWSEIYRVMPTPHVVLPHWIKLTAVAAVVLLIAGLGYRFINVNDALPDLPIETIKTHEPQLIEQEKHTNNVNIVLVQTDDEVNSKWMAISETAINPATGSAAYETYTENVTESGTDISEAVDQEPETDDRQSAVVRKTEPLFPRMDLPRKKRKKESRLMAMAYVSNYMSDSYHSESISQTNITKNINSSIEWVPVLDYPVDISDPDDFTGTEVSEPIIVLVPRTVYDTVTVVTDIQTDNEYRHHQPIRFGMMLLYKLNDHWSLESGLSYTRLVSEITTRVDGQITDISRQRLHYIGIPLNLGYQFRIYKRTGMYIKAGGTIDKMLNSSSWQFSLNGAAGVDYELTDRFNLYLEPGIGYYFNDGSSISTIYKDHPLNYNLSIGLRFNIK
jgi:hypothetical protein